MEYLGVKAELFDLGLTFFLYWDTSRISTKIRRHLLETFFFGMSSFSRVLDIRKILKSLLIYILSIFAGHFFQNFHFFETLFSSHEEIGVIKFSQCFPQTFWYASNWLIISDFSRRVGKFSLILLFTFRGGYQISILINLNFIESEFYLVLFLPLNYPFHIFHFRRIV